MLDANKARLEMLADKVHAEISTLETATAARGKVDPTLSVTDKGAQNFWKNHFQLTPNIEWARFSNVLVLASPFALSLNLTRSIVCLCACRVRHTLCMLTVIAAAQFPVERSCALCHKIPPRSALAHTHVTLAHALTLTHAHARLRLCG